MRELIKDNNILLMTISRFGIPFGFGDETIEKVCNDNGVHIPTFLSVCNLLSGLPYDNNDISLESLMQYLTLAHASFLDVLLPNIRRKLIEGITSQDSGEIALMLINFFDEYVIEVRRHMEHENTEIFSYVSQLIKGDITNPFRISSYSESHDHTVAKLNELKDLFIYHFRQKENIKLTTALFDIIVCEKDMMTHFEVESKLFIPLVVNLEKQLLSRVETYKNVAQDDHEDDETLNNISKLSDREREIIRLVALGKANKEIAETLCLSTHTVTTHRRNISSKLGIHSTAALIIFALLHKIIDLSDVKHGIV